MKELRFSGYSDDVAYCHRYIDGKDAGYNDIGAFDRTAIAKVGNDKEGCYVVMRYAPNDVAGTWAIGISQLDEGIDLPEWARHPTFDNEEDGYTVILILEVPDDVDMKWLEDEE